MIQYRDVSAPPGILPGVLPNRSTPLRDTRDAREARDTRSTTRFVMQSHALGTPLVSPGALLIAATIAFALYLIGCRLSD